VFGRCETTTGIKPFGRLVQQVMEQEPYRKAHRVFWIVDNGSSHRGAASVRRLQGKYSNLILVHLLTTVPPSRLTRLATGANICRWFRSPRGNPAEHFTNYISEDEAACMARIGLKHVRLCVAPRVIMDRTSGEIIEERGKQLEAAIERFHHAGLLVLVDIHNEDRAAELDPAWQEAFVRFWGSLATRLSRLDPELTMLEIINEPVFDRREEEWNTLNARLAAKRKNWASSGGRPSSPLAASRRSSPHGPDVEKKWWPSGSINHQRPSACSTRKKSVAFAFVLRYPPYGRRLRRNLADASSPAVHFLQSTDLLSSKLCGIAGGSERQTGVVEPKLHALFSQ
jgi:hypothetical protein